MKYNSERSLKNESLSEMGRQAGYQRQLRVVVHTQHCECNTLWADILHLRMGACMVDAAEICTQQDQVFYKKDIR